MVIHVDTTKTVHEGRRGGKVRNEIKDANATGRHIISHVVKRRGADPLIPLTETRTTWALTLAYPYSRCARRTEVYSSKDIIIVNDCR